MSSLVDQVSAAGLADRFLNDRQLAELLGGSDARRYGLVNRA
ncbi:putative DNA-binding transcriptional regulator AlpA, partial [Agrobacterium tumefaciens]|nr:putative DNA-binding transcriptional regulator AlpA [Agrobacterium tumefaciens]